MIVAFLAVSLEGAAEVVVDGVPHGDEAAHQAEFGHALDAHDGSTPDSELDGEHCEHCCHGHASSITASVSATGAAMIERVHSLARGANLHTLTHAPPTPPPNA